MLYSRCTVLRPGSSLSGRTRRLPALFFLVLFSEQFLEHFFHPIVPEMIAGNPRGAMPERENGILRLEKHPKLLVFLSLLHIAVL